MWHLMIPVWITWKVHPKKNRSLDPWNLMVNLRDTSLRSGTHFGGIYMIPARMGPRIQFFQVRWNNPLKKSKATGIITPRSGVIPLIHIYTYIYVYGCFLKWWYPHNTPKWSSLVEKPMVVGYHYFPKHPYKYFNDPRFFSLQKRNIQPREGHTNYHSFQASRRPRPSGEKISRSAAPGGDSCHPSALKVTISTYKWACDQNSPGGVDPVFYIGGGDVHIHIYLSIYIHIYAAQCPVVWEILNKSL